MLYKNIDTFQNLPSLSMAFFFHSNAMQLSPELLIIKPRMSTSCNNVNSIYEFEGNNIEVQITLKINF